jgi:selenide,water dikinase
MSTNFDLLSTVENGGCSAKLPAGTLSEIVKTIPQFPSDNLLVGNDTSDDALVYKINDQEAIIQTTDFFPPVCSDPYLFGQIAATNALSDIYAMGGKAITALNIVQFPSASIDIAVLQAILAGGAEKVIEAEAVLAGGHTIDGAVPVYGLSVTGTVHPDKIMKNSAAREGELIVLTKGLGTGTVIAGQKIGETKESWYKSTTDSMSQLNKKGAEVLKKYGVACATDITGFGLLGHILEMAKGSGHTLTLESSMLPVLPGAFELLEFGCIPGAAFRNLKHVEGDTLFHQSVNYSRKMLACDAQTSGGLCFTCKADRGEAVIGDLKEAGYPFASVIGAVDSKKSSWIEVF